MDIQQRVRFKRAGRAELIPETSGCNTTPGSPLQWPAAGQAGGLRQCSGHATGRAAFKPQGVVFIIICH